jgi:hypothetical protein
MDRPLDDFSAVSDGAVFLYRPHGFVPHAFEILKKAAGDMIPVGEYMVLDTSEDPSMTEKKVMNLVSLMNGNTSLIDIGADSGKRLYFHIVPKSADDTRQQIVFRERGYEGVTRENALLLLDGDIFHGTH